MVTAPRGRRGASTFGCVLWLVLFIAAIYYGSKVGGVYWRLYALRDAMENAARFAATQPDDVLRRQLNQSVDEIGLPPQAKRFRIRRTGSPATIVIETTYEEVLDLPLIKPRTLTFHPKVQTRF